MKKVLSLLVVAGVLFAWNIKSSEKYVLEKTIEGVDAVYNVNGDILYLDNILKDLKKMVLKYKDVNATDFGYPINIKELKYVLLHNNTSKITSYNYTLRLLEYAIFITAYNYGRAKGEERKILAKQYKKLIEDFRTLLKMSRAVAKYRDELYYPTYFRFDQYKNYVVGPELYNFIYGYKIKEKRKF